MPTVLGVGAWFKNTVCRIHQDQALITHPIGDLDQVEACLGLASNTRELLHDLPELALQAIAHDLHPDFYSTRFALQLAAENRVPALAIQHHHAHIAAVCAEHHEDFQQGPILGLALDGVGLGSDGKAWGGELLCVDRQHFQRLGHLHPLALPGGDKAAREPWRMAAAVLFAAGRGQEIPSRFSAQPASVTVWQQLDKNLNCPTTSSMGRVFDAAAGLLGLCQVMNFEAEAAISLEHAATRWIDAHGWPNVTGANTGANPSSNNSNATLNLLPLLLQLADWPKELKTTPIELAAAHFHAKLLELITQWVVLHAQQTGINKIALAGGCFFNQLLAQRLPIALENAGLTVLMPKQLLPGDTAIALGQAWIAALTAEASAL